MHNEMLKRYDVSKEEEKKREEDRKKVVFEKNKKCMKGLCGKKPCEQKFTICHSAKNVVYDSDHFIERNTDSMSGSMIKLLKEKTSKEVAKIYTGPPDDV